MTGRSKSPASAPGHKQARDKAGDVFRRFFSLIERMEQPPEVKSRPETPRPRITDFSATKPHKR